MEDLSKFFGKMKRPQKYVFLRPYMLGLEMENRYFSIFGKGVRVS